MIKAREFLYIEEFAALKEMMRAMHDEVEPHTDFDDMVLAQHASRCLNDTSRLELNVWIVYRNEKPIGFGVGRITTTLYSAQRRASLAYIYVQPKYRRTRAAFEILHNFQNWAKLNNAVIQIVGAESTAGNPTELLEMYKRRGFVSYGETLYRLL